MMEALAQPAALAVGLFDVDVTIQGEGLREFRVQERFEFRHAHLRIRHVPPCSVYRPSVTLASDRRHWEFRCLPKPLAMPPLRPPPQARSSCARSPAMSRC
ncbi:hypothetical protein BRAS3843_200023 [Bradyrhizobium sp. STM 3843]|nr:hypothetical protein BRAS3843_200023 [Bradyrhizobium sp. STM 3843]